MRRLFGLNLSRVSTFGHGGDGDDYDEGAVDHGDESGDNGLGLTL